MSDDDRAGALRAARLQQDAEQRAVIQATMLARRAGKLPGRAKSSTGSEAVTALVVLVVVVGMLVLVMRNAG